MIDPELTASDKDSMRDALAMVLAGSQNDDEAILTVLRNSDVEGTAIALVALTLALATMLGIRDIEGWVRFTLDGLHETDDS